LRRVERKQVLDQSALTPGRPLGYRDVQRAIQALYATGQFDDVRVTQDTARGRQILVVRLHERPILLKWAVRGVSRLSEGSVRDKAQLAEGRPLDLAAVARARGRIDSLYRAQGYYLAQVKVVDVYEADSARVRVIFDVDEGRRVAVARVQLAGNTHLSTDLLVGQMKTRPEGFWWFRSGEFDDERLREDLQERLPKFYGDRGYVDFQVLDDTLVVDDTTGKATLVVRVSEGEPYRVGSFEIVGNRRFSTEELQTMFPFKGGDRTGFLDWAVRSKGRPISASRNGTTPPSSCGPCITTTATSTSTSGRRSSAAPAPTASRWWTCAGRSTRGSPPSSTRSRSRGTTSRTSG